MTDYNHGVQIEFQVIIKLSDKESESWRRLSADKKQLLIDVAYDSALEQFRKVLDSTKQD